MNTAKPSRTGIRNVGRQLNVKLDRLPYHRLSYHATRMSPGVRRPPPPNYLSIALNAIAAYIRWHNKMAKIDPAFDYAAITRWGLECGKTKRDPEWEEYVQRTYGKKRA